ncbi:MAG: hypothetical protein ACK4K7_07380 [Allosphingosinicella sp.]|uniref:hypothetical protein n=1 Tax=Allosphingosinicella sp. TaxID=2823234 RepID=UPI003962A27C
MSDGAENLSTRHQRDGDAKHPSDLLDKGQQAEDERGRPASFDRQTGEVHGSGSGAGGGGNPAEDHDKDPMAGAGKDPMGAPRDIDDATPRAIDPDEGV